MAKSNTVYSLFGMESPQQVAARQLKEQQAYIRSASRDPYQLAGASIGTALGRLFGGKSKEMQQAEEREQIVKDVMAEEATAQQDASILDIGAVAEAEATQRGMAPKKSRAEMMMDRLTKSADLYDKIATRLDAAGFSQEAERARNKALESGLGVFSLQKSLADIAYTQARTKGELMPEFKDRGRFMDEAGNVFYGGLVGNQVVDIQSGQVIPNAMPAPSQPQTRPTSVATVGQAGMAMPLIEAGEKTSDMSAEEQGQMAGWIANKAQQYLDNPQTSGITDPNEAMQRAYQEAMKFVKPTTGLSSYIPFTADFQFDVPTTTQQPAPAKQPASPAQKQPTNLKAHQAANDKAKAAGKTEYVLGGKRYKVQ